MNQVRVHIVTQAEVDKLPQARDWDFMDLVYLQHGGFPQHWRSTVECLMAFLRPGLRLESCPLP